MVSLLLTHKCVDTMFFRYLISSLFVFYFQISFSSAAQFTIDTENTNIVHLYDTIMDYNRLRLESITTLAPQTPTDIVIILDNNTVYDRSTGSVENELEVYRAYFDYRQESYSIIGGKQRVPFGVGRIWNPIDVFNPIDILSVEPEEREGTKCLRGEYAPSFLSSVDLTIAEDKGAGRIKSYLNEMDIAFVYVHDNEKETDIAGWEIEGEFVNSGIELRSEGGIFYDTNRSKLYTDAIFGAEYAFPFPLTCLLEMKLNSDLDTFDGAVQLSSQINPLFSASLLFLYSFTYTSSVVSPNITYSLSDEMTLSIGAFIYGGVSSVDPIPVNLAYVNWFVQF